MQVWFNFSAIIPVVEKEWGLSATQSGMIVAFFHVGYVVAVIVYSMLSDKYNPKYSFVFGALIAGVSGIIFALFARDFWSVLLLRMISGIGIAGIYVPGMKLISQIFPIHKRGGAIGIYVGSLVAGSGFSLFVSGLIIHLWGWQGVILVTSLACLLSSLLVWLTPVPRGDQLLSEPLRFSHIRKVIRKPNLLINFSYAGHSWELYAMWAWIGPFLVYYLGKQGYSGEEAIRYGNLFGSAVIMLGSVATYLGGKLSDRMGRSKTIYLFISFSILCSLTIGWLDFIPVWAMIIITMIYGFTIIADSPVYNTAITEVVEPELVGISLGVQSVIGFSVTIVAPLLFGFLLDRFHWGMAFTVIGLVTLVTPLCVYHLEKSSRFKEYSA